MSRVVILGVGAVGGTLAVALTEAGEDVLGIARGAQLEAIRAGGLTLRTADGDRHASFACVASPAEAQLRDDDVIFLCVKTQHTEAALMQLRDAGLRDQHVFCFQNGVENERLALRYFHNVHGVTVMLPADFVQPGEVVCYGAPCIGSFDIGRFPAGSDAADAALVARLEAAGFPSAVREAVMQRKYGKLLMNLGNIVGAALGEEIDGTAVTAALKAEAEAVMAKAGIAWSDPAEDDDKRAAQLKIVEVPGVTRVGSSTAQSLARGAGSVETDYLNGEVSLLGRQLGVATPGNDWFTQLAARLVRNGAAPGAVTLAEVEAALGL
ncbi:ketopantoate reductase family protein [Salipiger mangrovisoli]|uniref:2-dehydropantoate 2-reductase n=1 Tax=Salipiger mangrovisoli TaxID=2865933 RepID=A0ABR9X7Q5_9RHOB|nr:2-dehydropantoate 2-reductase N-terminal domain-containing protein [Salipiger mangrovisoli]MBE9639461.1 NAD(P)-binding domain-containing protein [Salipiger mangrovisoli]